MLTLSLLINLNLNHESWRPNYLVTMNRKEKYLSADPDMSNVEDLETGGNELPHSD